MNGNSQYNLTQVNNCKECDCSCECDLGCDGDPRKCTSYEALEEGCPHCCKCYSKIFQKKIESMVFIIPRV